MIENEEIKLVKSVGEKIRQRRLSLNLSQETLSFDSNIPRNQVGRIERGEINTSIIVLHKICKALNIEIKELF
ncbi:MAG: helix-turn-helix domain-containing protein [Flavobacterium sp.]|uniref:helix-turn-helix domain-containing protein n=1 Tax=Flavobacterium sp. TaxID=239 RepID=UPI0022BC5003|nr:helix-turn-helix transcriptional regulator [Flavobacterium sp.]MCZ8168193.1 helix-turn-helix transcriptional regulator [Flavobacterium sp.]MCZ8297252.1 helix-turn-helix transcriptional regulator [Flavobacterium sp.]